MGGSSGSQQQQSSSQSSPWAPAQPELKNILGSVGGINTGVTPYQQNALNTIQGNATGLPNFGPQVGGLSGQLLGGLPNLNQNLSNSAQTSQQALSPYLQSNYLNPMSNPYTGQAMNTLNQDITNQIQGQFAGAGQGFGPAEAQALARGLGQGESGVLFNQYNQNVGAQQGAAGQNMNIAGQANQGLLGNAQAGVGNLGNIANATNLGPLAQLQAASMAYNLPLAQLGGVEGLTLPIAGLGGQTQGQSNTQSQYNPSPWSMALGGAGLFGGGANSAASGILSFL